MSEQTRLERLRLLAAHQGAGTKHYKTCKNPQHTGCLLAQVADLVEAQHETIMKLVCEDCHEEYGERVKFDTGCSWCDPNIQHIKPTLAAYEKFDGGSDE